MNGLQSADWIKIFGCLDANDLLRCSLVSREWRSFIVQSVEINSLSCKETVGHFHEMRYSFNWESIENDRILLADDLKFLRSEWVLTLLKKVKRLYIHHPVGFIADEDSKQSLVPVLNQFVALEQLQLNALRVGKKKGATLKLSNLVCLTVAHFLGAGRLKLNTPKLTSFSTGAQTGGLLAPNCGRLRDFDFQCADKILYLDVEECEDGVRKFENLQILFCRSVSKDKVDSFSDFLAALPKLRELHCQYIGYKSVCRLLSAKCKKRRLDFNFYFCGFHIDTINELDAYLGEAKRDVLHWNSTGWETMLEHPNKLSPTIKYIWEIWQYDELLHYFERTSFASFFTRIIKIEEVELKQPIDDEPKFIEFLNACEHIRDLLIQNTSLNQDLLDELPVYQPFITDLTIMDEPGLELKFILDFKYLSSFATDQKVSLAFIVQAFEQLKLLTRFRVRLDTNRSICIGRDSIAMEPEKAIFKFKGETSMFTALKVFFDYFA